MELLQCDHLERKLKLAFAHTVTKLGSPVSGSLVIVPELFLVLFRLGTTSVRSGLGTFFVPEAEHAICGTESWCVAHGGKWGVVRERVKTADKHRSVPNTCSLHPTGRALGDRPSIHATANDPGIPRTSHGYGSAVVLATHEAIPPPLLSSSA